MACNLRARPSVSTMAWRLRPLIFFPASHGSGFAGPRTGSASDATALGRLDALAVDHGGCGACLAAGPLTVKHHQVVVDPLPGAVIAEPGKPAIRRGPGQEVLGQQAPGNAATQDVEDGVDDLPHDPGACGRRSICDL